MREADAWEATASAFLDIPQSLRARIAASDADETQDCQNSGPASAPERLGTEGVPAMGDEPLKLVTHITPADVASASEEPPLVVHTSVIQAIIGEAPEPPIFLPMQEPASYTIRTSPPDGAVEAYSGDGPQTADRYDNAVFFLAPDGRGTFTFRGHQGSRLRAREP
jgi:hypothetical protein